jgi:hypothetical protein
MSFVNEDKVIAKFGYWPQFCDAKIADLYFDFVNMSIEMTVNYVDLDKGVQSDIKLHFSHVSDYALQDIMEDNVLDELSVKVIDTSSIEVSFEACYGLNGTFRCKKAEVLDISA